ncbi:hypothetical protein DL765_001245 [Monosporascus sp. GIB2]|nr:hypothetical protein DL765_001245 [Monosporascus sp. GIB2]
MAVSQMGHLLKWDISDGSLLEDQSFAYRSCDDHIESNGPVSKAPSLASVSPDLEMLALGYRGGTVCLWELRTGELAGWARDEENKLASALLFNPNPNISLLLIIYTNHDLSLYDSWSGNLMSTHKACGVGFLSATCSPDGRTLATIDMHGNIQIWDFESLTLLYHVLSPSISFRILSFTSDGSSIVDVSDTCMRIWSPASLVRKNTEEDNSVSDDAFQLAVTEGQYETLRSSRITALCAHSSLPIVFAGKFNGEVIAFGTRTGQHKYTLYTHAHSASITVLSANNANVNMIASGDVHGMVQIWSLKVGPSSVVECESLLLQVHLPAQLYQLCFSPQGDHLLVATQRFDRVYSIRRGSCVGSLDFEPSERRVWRWIHSSGTTGAGEQFLLLSDHVLKKFSVREFPSKIDATQVHVQYQLGEGSEEAGLDSAAIYDETLVLDVRFHSGYVSSSVMFLFDLSGNSAGKEIMVLNPLSDLPPNLSKRFIGFSERTKSVLFLHKDSWVSSISSKNLALNQYMQHFFVPTEYVSTSNHVLPVSTANDSIVFCLQGELAVVKNGLNFQELKSYS